MDKSLDSPYGERTTTEGETMSDFYSQSAQIAAEGGAALQQQQTRELQVEEMRFLRAQNENYGYESQPEPYWGPPTRLERWYGQLRMVGAIAAGGFIAVWVAVHLAMHLFG